MGVCFGYAEHLAPPNGRGKTCQRCGRRIPTSPTTPADEDAVALTDGVPGQGESTEPPAEGTAAALPSARAGDEGHPPKDAPPAGGSGPAGALAEETEAL